MLAVSAPRRAGPFSAAGQEPPPTTAEPRGGRGINAGTVGDAIVQANRVKPDVIVMDVRLADGSGIEATREIRAQRPETKVLMLNET